MRIFNPSISDSCEHCAHQEHCTKEHDVTAHAVLVDCRSFYFVYCRLEEINRMPTYTGDHKKYETEIDSFVQMQIELPCLDIPQVTNGALAAELAIKFLTFRETNTFYQIHDLEQLFAALPEIHKTELLSRIKVQAHQTDENFLSQLHQFANCFDEYRYFFERESVAITGLFNQFVKIVCEYALEYDTDTERNGV